MADSELTTRPAVEALLLRSLTGAEEPFIDELIAQISALLRSRRPAIDDQIAAWDLTPRPPTAVSPDVVATVLAGAIKRVLVNPAGASAVAETVGIFSRSATWSGRQDMPGQLMITDEDLAQMGPTKSSSPRRGTIFTPPASWLGYR